MMETINQLEVRIYKDLPDPKKEKGTIIKVLNDSGSKFIPNNSFNINGDYYSNGIIWCFIVGSEKEL